MPSGLTTVNFGSYPGSAHKVLTITGQSAILSTSVVEAWCPAKSTTDHSADEHAVSGPRCVAGNITVGVGFTIDCFAPDVYPGPATGSRETATDRPDAAPMLQDTWTVAWAWA